MSTAQNRPFPIIPVVAAFLMMVDAVIGIPIYRANHPGGMIDPHSTSALRSRDLRFVDAKDGVAVYGGHVTVYDAVTGAEFPPLRDNDGFIRAVLNSLQFERTKRGIDAPPVFRLTYWSDKKITLEDLATGRHVGLGQFGAKNESVFMRFLTTTEVKS